MNFVFGGGDPIFDTKPRQVNWLLQEVEAGKLALPDFQRDFVWDPSATRDLLVSLMCRFPAGALLILKQDPAEQSFKPRKVELSPDLKAVDPPVMLVLDGQQRVTALYQALRGVGDTRFLVDLASFVDTEGEIDPDAVDFDAMMTLEQVKKGKEPQSDSEDWQYEHWQFPVHLLLTQGFEQWVEKAVAHGEDELAVQARRRLRLIEVRNRLLGPLATYNFPVIELPESTSLVAVCKIFETLNITGVKLSVFELLTARVWAYGENLRDLWADARASSKILEEFDVDPYNVLQAISLRAQGSAQRSEVLKLRAENISAHWESVVKGFAAVLKWIRDQCGIKTSKWLPYSMALVPLAAVWGEVATLRGPARGAALQKLSQFFWCTVFTANYDQGANSQAQADYKDIKSWLPNDGPPPKAVAEFSFSTSQLASARVNRRALYRGTMALTINAGAVDFHNQLRLTGARIAEQEIDAHHLFPKAWLADRYEGIDDPPSSELILNRALIDSETNQSIGADAPSEYLERIKESEIGPHLGETLESHLVMKDSQNAMHSDDYEGFLNARADDIADEIERVTGKTVTRD